MTARAVAADSPLVAIARDLGPLCDRVVFIGGAVAPLLHTDPILLHPRPTTDVDGVVETSTYLEAHEMEGALFGRGFTKDVRDAGHIHRWRAPSGFAFDLVPSGDHVGGTGNAVDRLAARTSVVTEVAPGVSIRHASAPGFLAMKWAAYLDRGADDPFASDDLEDVLGLIASRPEVVAEILDAPMDLQMMIVEALRHFGEHPDFEDLLAAHLNCTQDAAAVIAIVRERLTQVTLDQT